jgi:hypothetical protein
MITFILALSALVTTPPAERWVEVFVVKAMVVDGEPLDVAKIRSSGSPKSLCIPTVEARDMAAWFRQRDTRNCDISYQINRKDRLVFAASCPPAPGQADRVQVELKIRSNRYSGTYRGFGIDSNGMDYQLFGKIRARKVGICRSKAE